MTASPCASSDLEQEKSPPSSLMAQVFCPSTLSHCWKSPGSQSLDLPAKSGPVFCGSSAAKSWVGCRSASHTLYFSFYFPVCIILPFILSFFYFLHTSFCYGCQSNEAALNKGNYNSPSPFFSTGRPSPELKPLVMGLSSLLGLARAESGFPHTIVQPFQTLHLGNINQSDQSRLGSTKDLADLDMTYSEFFHLHF